MEPNMGSVSNATFFFLVAVLLLLSTLSSATPHHLTTLEPNPKPRFQPLSDVASSASAALGPTTYFEVTRPIAIPPNSRRCSKLVLSHSFAYTYGQPPVTARFGPCSTQPPSRIVLEWSAACAGRQFDRIFGVWVGGVELLRSCTAEPRASGVVWTVRKDVTRYSSLFSGPQTLAVDLANLVDKTYTGIYHVNVTLHFYFSQKNRRLAPPADLVLPISRDLPKDDGLWFRIGNSSPSGGKSVSIPRNAYKAVLEVYVSFHADDEFWYTNPPNDYIAANHLNDTPGNGPFREVVASLDGRVVGAVWPFTVVYTGGINPLLWRPITGIGSFDLPTYDIEITPFLGELLDGEPHSFSFTVTNALGEWYIDANLHLWLDGKSPSTTGSLIRHRADEVTQSVVTEFHGLDGQFITEASRRVSAAGWVSSSHGKITTDTHMEFHFKNSMVFSGNGSTQEVDQSIRSEQRVCRKSPDSVVYSEEIARRFPLYVYTGSTDVINGVYDSVSNLSLTFEERKIAGSNSGFFSSLKNSQQGEGKITVKGNLVLSGVGRTQQSYRFESTDGCYFRDVSSDNYTILDDKSGNSCSFLDSQAHLQPSSNQWM